MGFYIHTCNSFINDCFSSSTPKYSSARFLSRCFSSFSEGFRQTQCVRTKEGIEEVAEQCLFDQILELRFARNPTKRASMQTKLDEEEKTISSRSERTNEKIIFLRNAEKGFFYLSNPSNFLNPPRGSRKRYPFVFFTSTSFC